MECGEKKTTEMERINLIGEITSKEFKKLFESLETNEDKETALYYRCATDLELFALTYFPHYCKHPFSEFHYETFEEYEYGERQVRRGSGAPRGYAKSTIKALIKPIHDLCYGLEKFIVIFSNGESQALGKLRDIRSELLSNTDLINAYGIRFLRKQVAEGQFEVFAGDFSCKFEAYGSGSQVRGIRYGSERPSKIICDDVEHPEEVENESIRQKYFNWYQEDVVKIGDEKTNIEFIGTVLHKKSLLMDILENPLYSSKSYKAVISWSTRQDLWEEWKKRLIDLEIPKEERLHNADKFYEENKEQMLEGVKVLWPEKEPYVYLMKELVEGGKRAFMKEKQNDPQGSEDKVFEKFHFYREAEDGKYKGILIESSNVFIPFVHLRAYGVIDPATGQTKARPGKKGDFTCIVTGFTDPKDRLLVHRDWTRRVPPSEFIKRIFIEHEEWKYEKFGVETNLYRNLLLPNIIAMKKEIEKETKKSIQLPLYDIESIENKEKRIYTLEPKITNGYILFNRALSQEFMNQIEDFPKGDHDDCPDALEMLWGLVKNRYKMNSIGLNAMGGH